MKKWIKRIILTILIIFVFICFFLIFKAYGMYRDALNETSLSEKVESIQSRDDYITIEQLPPIYTKAVVAVEDHRFYEHKGIDIVAIFRALWNDIKAWKFIEGGSTITQQLSKNIYFTQEKKIERKIAEVFMAFKIESNYEKDEILELYVNTIYFGNNYYSVKEASNGYFDKEPKDMTDYESTLLAGIPNAPSVYALTANYGLASERQKQVLVKMVKHKVLTQAEADKILIENKQN